MKTKISWLVIGFVLSWLTWSAIHRIRSQPKDITEHWPEELREIALDLKSWMQTAQGKRAGQFVIWTPDDCRLAEAMIMPIEGQFPVIHISDPDRNGVLDAISVSDSACTSIDVHDKDGDRVFDSYGFLKGIHDTSILLSDDNLDGIFDTRLGPGPGLYVNIDAKWHKLIHKDGKRYIAIGGELKEVEPFNGVWRFKEK